LVGFTSMILLCPSMNSVSFATRTKAFAVAEVEGVAEGVGFAYPLIGTPLSHASFLPLLMQVYNLLRKITVWPRCVGFISGPVAASAPLPKSESKEPVIVARKLLRNRVTADNLIHGSFESRVKSLAR